VRLELAGKDVLARKISGGRFALRAGGHEVIVCPAESEFIGQGIVWDLENAEGSAAVEGICYRGPAKKFDFSQPIEMKLGFGFELRQSGDSKGVAKLALPTLETRPGKVIARWEVAPAEEARIEKLTVAAPNG